MKAKNKYWFSLFFIFLIYLSPSTAKAEKYEVEGLATYRIHLSIGTQVQAPVKFRLSVDQGKWYLRSWRMTNDAAEYRDVCFDGKEIKMVIPIITVAEQPLESNNDASQGNQVLRRTATAAIYPGPVILNSSAGLMEIPPVWLALASSKYFDELNGASLLHPAFTRDGIGTKYTYKADLMLQADWSRDSHEPYLPKQVVYYHEVDKQSSTGKWNGGITNAIFHVNSYTNVGPYRLPLSSWLHIYAPLAGEKKGNGQRVFCDYHVELKSAKTNLSVKKFDIEIPGKTLIADHRLEKEGKVYTYPNLNSSWLSTNQVVNQ